LAPAISAIFGREMPLVARNAINTGAFEAGSSALPFVQPHHSNGAPPVSPLQAPSVHRDASKNLIQARADVPGLPSAVESAAYSGSEEPVSAQEEMSPDQTDLEALTEKVLRKLMRQLSVEKERRGLLPWH
jgi:hypothetical protein